MNISQLPIIYTDGLCLKNPGIGGWAFILLENNKQISMSGSSEFTTNNRMKLQAVIEALSFIKSNECIIFTDSRWIINCATGLWKRKSNLDLWKKYENILKNRKIYWNWVKAHNDNKYNNLVDNLARSEAKNMKNKKY